MSPELTTFVVVMIETRGGPYPDLMKKKTSHRETQILSNKLSNP